MKNNVQKHYYRFRFSIKSPLGNGKIVVGQP